MMDPDSNNGKIVKMVLGGEAGVQVLQKETGEIVAGSASLATPAESSFAQPSNFLSHGPVMTDEQLETLRRQISVYATICNQLVEMHKASMVHQAVLPSIISGQNPLYDPAYSSRSTGRQRWTPSQSQLQILENLFEKGSGTPNKQKIKEIAAQLSQHGQISETNVYNWFQNRKARAKRKQQSVTQKDVDSEADTDEVESPKEKKATLVRELSLDNQESGKTPVNNLSIEENLGLVDQKRPHRSSQHDRSQCNAFSALLHPEVDSEVDKGSNSRPKREVNHENMSTHGSQSSFGTMIVLIDGKRWEVPSGALDLKGSFGESAVLLDSRRNVIPTDEIGFTFHPLNANESYTLARLSDVMGEIVSQSGTLHSYQGVDHSKKGFVNNPGLH